VLGWAWCAVLAMLRLLLGYEVVTLVDPASSLVLKAGAADHLQHQAAHRDKRPAAFASQKDHIYIHTEWTTIWLPSAPCDFKSCDRLREEAECVQSHHKHLRTTDSFRPAPAPTTSSASNNSNNKRHHPVQMPSSALLGSLGVHSRCVLHEQSNDAWGRREWFPRACSVRAQQQQQQNAQVHSLSTMLPCPAQPVA
jgi:hypothetical protein